jgi:hypothetical protein
MKSTQPGVGSVGKDEELHSMSFFRASDIKPDIVESRLPACGRDCEFAVKPGS